VRKSGGRVRITEQLVEGATGGHIWAERCDRNLKDIFSLQDEISQAIVGALKVKLLPEEENSIEQREWHEFDTALDLLDDVREDGHRRAAQMRELRSGPGPGSRSSALQGDARAFG
jgi:hypothetical protein